LKFTFQYELNEHRNKTEKTNAATMTANNKTPHSDDEIKTEKKETKKLNLCEKPPLLGGRRTK
jgi:hypothetical protein